MAVIRLKSESTSKSVFFSTFFSLVARLLSFVQAIIVSYYFGATKSTDFLFFCVSMTLLLPGLFININQSVIVPTAIKLRENKSTEESHRFVLYIYILYLAVGVLVCTAIGFMPEGFMHLASKFDIADIKENILIVRMLIPTFFFILANSYILNIFEANRYFTFPMISDMLKSLLTIGFILLLGKKYGVVSMAAGILIAYMAQFLMLNWFLIRLLGFKLRFKRYPLDKELRRNIMYVVISQMSTILSQYIAMYLISGLKEGVYTALSYSDKLFNIFVLVFTGQISTVLGINIIEMYAKGQFEKLNEQYQKYMKVTMTIILPVCFILAIQAPTVVSILLERGNFTSASVQLTSIFFQYTILTVPFLLLDRLIVRLIIAKQIMHISFLWNVVSKILTTVAIYIIVTYIDYRYYGLGLLFVQIFYIILLNLFMVKKQFKFINVNRGLLYLFVSILLCSMLGMGIPADYPLGSIGGLMLKIITLSIYSVLFMGGYFLIGFLTYNREAVKLLFKYAREII